MLAFGGGHDPGRLIQCVIDLEGQLRGGFQQCGHLRQVIQPELGGPLAIVLGVVAIVLNPVAQQFAAFFRETHGLAVVVGMPRRMVIMMAHEMLLCCRGKDGVRVRKTVYYLPPRMLIVNQVRAVHKSIECIPSLR